MLLNEIVLKCLVSVSQLVKEVGIKLCSPRSCFEHVKVVHLALRALRISTSKRVPSTLRGEGPGDKQLCSQLETLDLLYTSSIQDLVNFGVLYGFITVLSCFTPVDTWVFFQASSPRLTTSTSY